MPYIMRMTVDGGCRRNGYYGAIAAAAVVIYDRWGRKTIRTTSVDDYDASPTNQAAELTAILLALENARDRYINSITNPYMLVSITTDSKYAYGCMMTWRHKWTRNGWVNSAGRPVANQDLIRQAIDLEEDIEDNGSVTYSWVPREQNQDADSAVNDALDEME